MSPIFDPLTKERLWFREMSADSFPEQRLVIEPNILLYLWAIFFIVTEYYSYLKCCGRYLVMLRDKNEVSAETASTRIHHSHFFYFKAFVWPRERTKKALRAEFALLLLFLQTHICAYLDPILTKAELLDTLQVVPVPWRPQSEPKATIRLGGWA